MIEVTVTCPEGFNDMNILKQGVKRGESVTVDPNTYKRMKQSSPRVYVSERKMKLNPGAKERMRNAQGHFVKEEKDGKSKT